MPKQTKGQIIQGWATVVGTGSGCVGNMAWETPIVRFALNGERFTWQSDKVDHYSLHVGDKVQMSAFVRADENSDRLYRVKIFTVNAEL